MAIRVGTYNIAGAINEETRFYSKRGTAQTAKRVARARRTLDDIARFVAEQDISLLALQEVDVCHNGADTLHESEYLANRLDMRQAFLAGFDYDLARRWSVTTGVATVSAFDIVDTQTIVFPHERLPLRKRVKARLLGSKKALHVSVNVGGVRLHVVNAHLTHDDDRQKELELEMLMEYCSALDPCLLLGDLNTTPPSTRGPEMLEPEHFATDRCMDIFDRYRDRFACDARVFDAASVREICTHPAEGASVKLDYVLLFSAGGRATLSPERVEPAGGSSNHCLVTAELTVEDGK